MQLEETAMTECGKNKEEGKAADTLFLLPFDLFSFTHLKAGGRRYLYNSIWETL